MRWLVPREATRRAAPWALLLSTLLLSTLSLSTLLWATPAQARPPAFDPADDGWQGLGYLIDTAREAQVELRVERDLRWDDVSEAEVLLVVAPKVGLPWPQQQELRRFISAGGRLILADDFRAGSGWLHPFGMRLSPRPGPTSRHAGGVRHLPEVGRDGELGRFLGFHVDHVVLNHPAAVVATGAKGWRHRAHGRYDDAVRSWLMEATRPGQQGKLLVLADPSALINAMLRRFYGNKQLAANLLRYYCFEGEPCRVRLLANLRSVGGVFTPKEPGRGGPRIDIRSQLQEGSAALARWLQRRELRLLWWALLVALLLAPVWLRARLPGPQLPPPPHEVHAEGRLRATVRAWLARPGADYRSPAQQLAQHLTRLVGKADDGGGAERGLTLGVARLVRSGRLSESAGRRIERLVSELRELAGADAVDRARFTQLATEVEWAEQVLSHTLGPMSGPQRNAGRTPGHTTGRRSAR